MTRASRFPTRSILPSLLLLVVACVWPSPARAAFHLNEITKVLVGLDGDATIQAIEFKMIANGENLVNGKAIHTYNGAGTLLSTVGTFSADLPAANAVAGQTWLAATMKFKQRFGVTPDIQISANLPITSGQIDFGDATCLIDAVSYGAVTSPLVGPGVAPPLPSSGGAVLVRVFDPATFPSCPLADNSNQYFVMTTAGGNHPVTFTNYSNQTATVASTATGVDANAIPIPFRISPNPVRGSALIESPHAGAVRVYDATGRIVRTLTAGGSSAFRVTWNARDERGAPLPSGVYFMRQDGAARTQVLRFVVAR